VGTPVSSQYTTVFDYADPQIITTGGVEYRSPEVTLSTFGAVPNPSRRVQLNVTAGQLGDPPAFFASFANLQDFGDDPAAPTVGPFYALDADVSHDGNLRTGLDMGYDSGSQGTFVSEQVAATLGFDVVNDTPDFVVRLQTVTGQVDEVPGFIADQFTLPGTDGGLVLTDVPLIVFNLPDPRSAGNILDGLVGQNLFANRTVTLDPEPATGLGDPGPYLGLSGQALDNHDWASAAAAADFAAASSWTGAGNPAVDWIAHVESAAAFDQVANLAADASVSALNVVGDADRMAVAVQTGATLTVFGTAIVTGNGELRMAGGTVSTLAVEVRSGGHLTGEGTVAGEVIVLGNLTPGASAGVLHFADNLDLLASSTTTIELGGTSNAGPTQFDQVLVDQTSTVGGTLSLVVIGGYDPALGDAADILVADGGLAGTFDAVTGVSVDAGRSLAVTYLTDRVRVTAARPADANLDGAVNFSDFLLLQAAFGGKGTWADGDFNGSGGIDFSDFLVLQANFGAGAALAPAELSQQLAALAAFAGAHGPAPEPAAAAVLALAAPVLLGRRPRHNPATGG